MAKKYLNLNLIDNNIKFNIMLFHNTKNYFQIVISFIFCLNFNQFFHFFFENHY